MSVVFSEGFTTNEIEIEDWYNLPSHFKIQLQNNQNVATPAGLQVPINLTVLPLYKMFHLKFYDNNGNIIYAWIESQNLVWLKLPFSIPAGGLATLYASLSDLPAYPYTGINSAIAQQLGLPYEQYDNGAYVFDIYGNFQGSSMPSGWTPSIQAGSFMPQLSNGGLEMINNNTGQATALIYNSPFTTQNIIVEASWMYNGQTDNLGADNLGFGIYTSGPCTNCVGGWQPNSPNGYYCSYEFYVESKPAILVNGNVAATASSQIMPTSGLNYVFSQVIVTPSSITMNFITNTSNMYQSGVYSGLTTAVSYSGAISNSYSTFYVGAADGGDTSYIYLYWLRVRGYPPNGVMPTVEVIA